MIGSLLGTAAAGSSLLLGAGCPRTFATAVAGAVQHKVLAWLRAAVIAL